MIIQWWRNIEQHRQTKLVQTYRQQRLAALAIALLTTIAWLGSSTVIAQDENLPPREPGVSVRIYQLDRPISQLRPLVPGQTPNVSKVMPQVDFLDRRGDFDPFDDNFLVVVEGFLHAPKPGMYEFELTSDDGSVLLVNGATVIDHDGLHSASAHAGATELDMGSHPFTVRYFEAGGDALLRLKWKPPGATEFSIVPSRALACTAGEVRVTSPGPKRVFRALERGTPGDGQPLDDVHPSYTLTTVRPDGFEPRVGGIDWLSDGRMVVTTWDPDGSVYVLQGTAGDDPQRISAKRIAAGLAEPLGLCVVDDDIYVLQKQELTRLIDHDGDDVIDEYRCICSGWDVTANFHEFAFGLVYDEGYFYANLAIAIDPGGRSTSEQVHDRGSTIRISPDGDYEVFARGLRTPNGIGFGIDGELFVSDNQGDWVPVSKIVHLQKGAFYGSRAVLGDAAADMDVTPPVVWLPQGEIGNSPSEIAPLPHGRYAGQMIHGDVTHGGLKRVFAEKVNGQFQGAVFRFTQGLEAGVNRVRIGPDDAIYIGGIGSTGNWGQAGKKRFGLQRLDYNSNATFEMLAVRAMSNGLEIEFTEPLAEGYGWSPEQYFIEQFRYKPTSDYGGPKLDQQRLTVQSANVSEDRRRVFLELDNLKAGHVQYIRLLGPWNSDAGESLWSTEAWYTMNAIPQDRSGEVVSDPPLPEQNTLTEQERAAGWELLFDGRTAEKWRGFRRDDLPEQWKVVDGALVVTGGGDIVSKEQFDDFELQIEWKVEPGGNSGIFFNVSEDRNYVWETGPEMQILDNSEHADGANPLTSAGSCYALYPPPVDASYPPGIYNTTRIRVEGDQVTYWLNGQQTCSFEIGSDEWNERVAGSKFSDMPMFGKVEAGHIALQDHGDRMWFRNIKIRRLEK